MYSSSHGDIFKNSAPERVVMKDFFIVLSKISDAFLAEHIDPVKQNAKTSKKVRIGPRIVKKLPDVTKAGMEPNAFGDYVSGTSKSDNSSKVSEKMKKFDIMPNKSMKRPRIGPNICKESASEAKRSRIGTEPAVEKPKPWKKSRIGPNIPENYQKKALKVKIGPNTNAVCSKEVKKKIISLKTIIETPKELQEIEEETRNTVDYPTRPKIMPKFTNKNTLEKNVKSDIDNESARNLYNVKLKKNYKLIKKQNRLLKDILRNILLK